ncbi:hemolysin family protein [Legionella spiritensis]|uniref:Metal ion transporter n=1 Tax=Legionella spiritensis TaxID=452 RepID=A0A0W0YWG4_LEGSP|nr:metal ion transporter [Legionella spiritensis]SNV23615.1 metal ion transporter [Legionella spiritensis]
MTLFNLMLIFFGMILVLLNGFFVAAEFGMVKLRNTRVALITEQYPLRGAILARIHQQLDAYLSACQLGITLASLGLGWIGEPAFARLLSPLLPVFGITNSALIEFISFLFAFSLISFLHIVIGELMPKSLAIRQSEQISLWTAVPLYVFYWMMYPAIWLLNFCSNFFLKLLGLDVFDPTEQYHTSDEIKLILRSSQMHGELTPQASSILAHTLELADLQAVDLMRSSDDIVMINSPITKKKLTETTNHHRFSRYPVFDQEKKQIIGLLHVKDVPLFLNDYKDDEQLPLQSLIRPIPKVSHRLPALALLRQFQGGMPHFALVYGRHGTMVGFITLDHLLHLVIGVIKDEFHKTQDTWIKHGDGSLTVKGDCPLYALERALGKEILLTTEEEEEVATIAGLILYRLGSVPGEGKTIEFPDFSATVENTQGAKITQVKIVPNEQDTKKSGSVDIS